jgi:hypothetical protein
MTKRTLILLVVLVVVIAAAVVLYILDPFKPAATITPSPIASAEPTSGETPTEALLAPSATLEEATPTPTPAEGEQAAATNAPTLLAPPDETAGSMIQLVWNWLGELGEDQWFEVQIWPDLPDAQPGVFGWQKPGSLVVTSAHLMPGKYRWRVVVVLGSGESRGEELSDFSAEGTFIITRPSTKATMSVTPPLVPSRTPSSTVTPTPTQRRYPWLSPTSKPKATYTPTYGPTVIAPTVTPSITPVPTVPTAVPTMPTMVPTVPTVTLPTATPSPVPTTLAPTNTPEPYEPPASSPTPSGPGSEGPGPS